MRWFTRSKSRARLFYDSFDIQNDLILRTATLILKSTSLQRESLLFYEDASVNLYFGIDGTLRTIFKKYIGGEFVFDKVVSYIDENNPYGYEFKLMLEEIYEKRVQIVHPENRFDMTWLPQIYVDEFFEHYDIGVELFCFAITGEYFPKDQRF